MERQETTQGSEVTNVPTLGGAWMDYYFDMAEDSEGNKQMQTFAFPNWPIGELIEGDATKTWTEMMEEALPAIQADIDQWGIIQ